MFTHNEFLLAYEKLTPHSILCNRKRQNKSQMLVFMSRIVVVGISWFNLIQEGKQWIQRAIYLFCSTLLIQDERRAMRSGQSAVLLGVLALLYAVRTQITKVCRKPYLITVILRGWVIQQQARWLVIAGDGKSSPYDIRVGNLHEATLTVY